MQKSSVFSLLVCLLFSCQASQKLSTSTQSNQAPNIIFILADDQGYGDLGCYGSTTLKTPNLDRMATEGMLFTQAYVGSPVCAPTRCSLLTGKHTGHTTRRDNRASHEDLPFMQRKLIPLRDEDYTIGEMMKEAGYLTGCIGKWGLGNPGTTGPPYLQGFDHFLGYIDQVHAHDYYTSYLFENADTLHIPENRNGQKEVYSHDLMATDALEFIRENQDTSFFLYLPLCLPHGKYEIPDNSAYADKDWPEQVKNYAAMITLMDHDIGRIFSLLDELQLDDNTLVVFTSDNGPNPPFVKALESNKPFRGTKRQLLEGGIRTPMIARWPGKIAAGVKSELAWAFWDVMPTLADLADFDLNVETDGISVLPTLVGNEDQQETHDFLYWEFYNPFHQAVRIGDWKGIRLGTAEPIHLFNLKTDMREENNLAAQHPEVVRHMEVIMEQEHEPSPYWPTLSAASKGAKKLLR